MRTAEKTSSRRMGPAGSPVWHAMLDGAEEILREQGHAALTSRAVAERCGVKQRLVYYYFQTMDDLVVETFRRLSARELERLQDAAAAPKPVTALWDVATHSSDARLVAEFMALANRVEQLKAEVVAFIEKSRETQESVLARAWSPGSRTTRLTPSALALLATSAALAINREAQIGVDSGHRDLAAAIEAFISDVEDRPA